MDQQSSKLKRVLIGAAIVVIVSISALLLLRGMTPTPSAPNPAAIQQAVPTADGENFVYIKGNSLLELQNIIDSNEKFRELFETVIKPNTGFTVDGFSVGEVKPMKVDWEYPSEPEDEKYPVWTTSPNGAMAVSAYTSLGEPDHSLHIYNRDNNGKVERLKFCGTPCSYWGTLWLNDRQFIFVQIHEYYPPGEIRCTIDTKCTDVVSISLYDLPNSMETVFESKELEKRINFSNWPDWEERMTKILEGI